MTDDRIKQFCQGACEPKCLPVETFYILEEKEVTVVIHGAEMRLVRSEEAGTLLHVSGFESLFV